MFEHNGKIVRAMRDGNDVQGTRNTSKVMDAVYDERHPVISQLCTQYPELIPMVIENPKAWVGYMGECSPCLYIEGQGGQYINTDMIAVSKSRYYEIDFLSKTYTGTPEMEVWGCWDKSRWNCWANKNESTLSIIQGKRGANERVVMGKTLSGNDSNTKPICIMAWHNISWPCTGVQIFRYKVMEDGVTIMDLRPVYKRKTREVGMFDMISATFFENKGTGELLRGEDSLPIELQ